MTVQGHWKCTRQGLDSQYAPQAAYIRNWMKNGTPEREMRAARERHSARSPVLKCLPAKKEDFAMVAGVGTDSSAMEAGTGDPVFAAGGPLVREDKGT